MAHPGGRPSKYSDKMLKKAFEYIAKCNDWELPNKAGLALHLNVRRSTLYEWAEEHPEFSDIMDKMNAKQEEFLIKNGISGRYNPTITKVMMSKHGYREGIDHTSDDKPIQVTPIYGGTSLPGHNSDAQGIQPKQKN